MTKIWTSRFALARCDKLFLLSKMLTSIVQVPKVLAAVGSEEHGGWSEGKPLR